MTHCFHRLIVLSFLALVLVFGPAACTPVDPLDPELGKLPESLISAETTLTTAWDFPNNPLDDESLGRSDLADQIRWGFRLFTETSTEAPHLSGADMSCNNCHLNGGQRELALPLIGVTAMLPEYNRRAGRDFTIEDRIVGCFFRSQNATGALPVTGTPSVDDPVLPRTDMPEVEALAAYLRWLSRGFEPGEEASWRQQNRIAAENQLPLGQLDPELGKTLFMDRCTNCHGEDGQGVWIGDKKAGPLWGPGSWNDGAGAARIYTLAGIIRYMMPYLDPGSTTDEEAQHIAAFINAQERPAYPFKELDYLTAPLPADSVYYPSREAFNE